MPERIEPPPSAHLIAQVPLWEHLPLVTRQRLVWIFSQMLASQLAVQRPKEESHDSYN